MGMPHGTASHKLRKMILFSLVQRIGEDVCYRCGRKIENLEQFSIEHKKKWLGIDAKLFWDLDNIAFSHLSCNSENADRSRFHRMGGQAHRKVGEAGAAWCVGHKFFRPVTEFTKLRTNWNGLDQYCRACKHEKSIQR